jgi:hypothetical protein
MVAHFGLIPKVFDADAKECDKVVDGKILCTKLSTRCMSGKVLLLNKETFHRTSEWTRRTNSLRIPFLVAPHLISDLLVIGQK